MANRSGVLEKESAALIIPIAGFRSLVSIHPAGVKYSIFRNYLTIAM